MGEILGRVAYICCGMGLLIILICYAITHYANKYWSEIGNKYEQ